MTSDWRSWRRRICLRHMSPILKQVEDCSVTLDALVWRRTTAYVVGLPTVKLWSLKTETRGACTSDLSIRALQNRSSPRWPEAHCSWEPRLQMANGISDVFGRTGRVLNTKQSLFRSCEFRWPEEPQKRYCSSHRRVTFPAPSHHPIHAC